MSEKTTGLVVLGGVAAFFAWAARGTRVAYAPSARFAEESAKPAPKAPGWTIFSVGECAGWRSRVKAGDELFFKPLKIGKTEISIQPHSLPRAWEEMRQQKIMPSNLCPIDDFMVEIRGPIGPEDFPDKEWVGSFKYSGTDYGSDREFPYREPSKKSREKRRRQEMYWKGRNIKVGRNAESISTAKLTRVIADLAQRNGVRLTDVGT